MPSNQTLVNPQRRYPNLAMEPHHFTNCLYQMAPEIPTTMPCYTWNSQSNGLYSTGLPCNTWNSENNCLCQTAPIPTGMAHNFWDSETNSLFQDFIDYRLEKCQTAPISTAMPCSSIWDSESNYGLYQPAPMSTAMPCNTSDSELAVQRIPLSELQNSGAMKLFRSKLERYAQMRSSTSNSQNRINFGTIPAGTRASDDFMMFRFKVERCPSTRGHHDWTDCQYLHPGEKARRRDPRKYLYSGKPCADFRKRGQCENGDRCHFSHGVFETWLHPDKYKTQMCRDLLKCQRKVCFFAHSENELREGDGVIEDISLDMLSPKSVLSMDHSPPDSPTKLINHYITRNTAEKDDQYIEHGVGNVASGATDITRGMNEIRNTVSYDVDCRNSNCGSEINEGDQINIEDCRHVSWIADIVG